MSKKVLIVEDDLALRDLLTFRLQEAGHEVVGVGDGDEAVRRANADKPDVVLLDLMLPGKHGYEVCRSIRGNPELARTKIIVISAKSFPADIKVAKNFGVEHYLVKPFDVRILLPLIEPAGGEKK